MADHSSEHHLISLKYYFGVFILLMALTMLTVTIAKIDLGEKFGWPSLNIIVALTIAVIKATAVVLIFMHLRWSSKLTQVVAVSGVFWLIILIAITISDYLTRDGWPPKNLEQQRGMSAILK